MHQALGFIRGCWVIREETNSYQKFQFKVSRVRNEQKVVRGGTLLGYNECSLSMYSNNQSDPPRSSNDRDMSHEHTRRKETQKYLRESYHYHIKCTATTFLAAFMWRRHLNSTVLATTTHRKPKMVSDGTGTQVRAQMINKWRMKMVQMEIYKVKGPP